MENLCPENIRNAILNTSEPLLIKNILKSNFLSLNLTDWNNLIGDEVLPFRCGINEHTKEPQWETTCPIKKMKFQDFLKHVESSPNEWLYFDYKHLCQWFTDKEVFQENLDWSALGFPEIKAKDSTMWIGSKGAHTPCHIDTYGFNIVYQIYGRKQWILFPPEQNLKPTRIPFEESSIYSKLNFFSPSDDFRGLGHCHKVILEPGDVLVVPNKWWHYVENLDTAISVNAWVPLEKDNFERMKESIATVFVAQMAETEESCKDTILNPNMLEGMMTSKEALNIIDIILNKNKPKRRNQTQIAPEETDNVIITKEIKNINCIFPIPQLTDAEFRSFINFQLQRFPNSHTPEKPRNKKPFKEVINFLEAVTDDEVLSLIAKKLCEKQ